MQNSAFKRAKSTAMFFHFMIHGIKRRLNNHKRGLNVFKLAIQMNFYLIEHGLKMGDWFGFLDLLQELEFWIFILM